MSDESANTPSVEQLAAAALGKTEAPVVEAKSEPTPVIEEPKIEEPKVEAKDAVEPPKTEEAVKKVEPEVEAKKEDKKPEESTKKEKDEVDKAATRFAALSRKEKALRMREKDLETRATKVKDLEALLDLAKNDPIEAIGKLGLTYEQLTSFILDPKRGKPELGKLQKLEQEVEALRKEREESQKMMEENKINSAVAGFKSSIKEAISKTPDKYECLLADPDAEEIVYEIINQDFDMKAKKNAEDGLDVPDLSEALSIEEAAEIAEKHLYAEYKKEYEKFQKLSKFAPKTEPIKVPEKIVEPKVEKKPEATPTTLTNSMTNSTPPSLKKMENRDAEINAITEAFKGKLFEKI